MRGGTRPRRRGRSARGGRSSSDGSPGCPRARAGSRSTNPREGEPIGRVVGAGRLVLRARGAGARRRARPLRRRARRGQRRLVIEGRLVPVERGREVEGRVTAGRSTGGWSAASSRHTTGRARGARADCGLEVGRDGRLSGRDVPARGSAARATLGPRRTAGLASGPLGRGGAGSARRGRRGGRGGRAGQAGPPSRARAMRPAATGVDEDGGRCGDWFGRSWRSASSRTPTTDTKWCAAPGLLRH